MMNWGREVSGWKLKVRSDWSDGAFKFLFVCLSRATDHRLCSVRKKESSRATLSPSLTNGNCSWWQFLFSRWWTQKVAIISYQDVLILINEPLKWFELRTGSNRPMWVSYYIYSYSCGSTNFQDAEKSLSSTWPWILTLLRFNRVN